MLTVLSSRHTVKQARREGKPATHAHPVRMERGCRAHTDTDFVREIRTTTNTRAVFVKQGTAVARH